MLDTIRSLLAEIMGDTRRERRYHDDDYRLAAAALLVHLLTADGSISPRERARLHAVLKYRFQLDERQTDQLIAEATLIEGESVDLYGFTHLLNRMLDDEGRARIVEMMWELSYADGKVDEFEDNLIWRAADLLNVPAGERIAMRNAIAARNSKEPEPPQAAGA